MTKPILEESVSNEDANGRSFCDQGLNGPIGRCWNIFGWRAIYVLDFDGTMQESALRRTAPVWP